MKKLFFAFVVVALTFTGCNDEELVNETPKQKGKITTIIEQGASNSRLAIDSNNTISWSPNDVIRIFMVDGEYYDYKYNESGDFEPVDSNKEIPNETINSDVLGVCAIPVDDDPVYDSSHSLDGDKLSTVLPQNVIVQTSTDGTIILPMWGTWDNWNILFKHLAGVLRVNLEGVPDGYDLLSVITDKPISGSAEVEDVTVDNAILKMATDGVENHMNIRFTNAEDKVLYLPLPVETYASIKIQISKYDENLGEGEYKDPIRLATYTNKTVERAYIYTASMDAIKVWDGSSIVPVADTDPAGSKVLYEVAHAEELAWVLREWNGGSTSASRPTTIKLMNDIDFGGYEIYFDKEDVSFHSITLDGNNHTIKNYKVAGVTTGGSGYKAGLFPQTSGITIKDLTIDNAVIGSDQTAADLYSGALIGIATDQLPTPYTTVIENVTIQNSSISGVNKVGGLIGQANGIHIVTNAEVKNTTITGYGTDAGSLGGLYGSLKVIDDCTFTNSKMTGGSIVSQGTKNEDKSRANSGFIGVLMMGTDTEASLNLTNCEVSNETTITHTNTMSMSVNELIGAVRSGTGATLTIDGETIYYFVKTWDGSSIVQVSDRDPAGSKVLYEVVHAEELAWVLREWNGGSTSASRPTTIKLLNDIDFGGKEIYFGMTEVGGFHSITLDGNNHTIKNYKVAGVTTGGSGYKAGLFPQTSGITIKDLTIDNAVIGSDQTAADLYSGALIGIATDQLPTPYTTVIENVTIQNSSISGVNKVGGLIGQANGIHIVTNAEVKNTTITGYGTDAGSLGGLYGSLKVIDDCTFTNSKMTGGSIVSQGTKNEDKSRANSGFIGVLMMGTDTEASLNLTNCEVSNETTITHTNTMSMSVNELIGAVRSGTGATLIIDGTTINY